ncbi:hypothetical protein [Streptomyces sp. AC495_CC817]|uniref:hypothetical protein n=1 Tax=Streptomyces sp. AC495_CC817 TaxID=2823900 RepID=UPI001C268D92|nr:hypothetical protein [Streptomyces sp. AC495_CC817]
MTRTAGILRTAGEGARRGLRAVIAPSSMPLWIAAIVVLGVAIPFVALGGLAPASRTPAPAAAGDEVQTSLYAVTVLRAELTDEVEEQYFSAEPGDDLLVVTVVLENLSDAPVGVLQSVDRIRSRIIGSTEPLIDLAGVDPTDAPRAWREESVAAVVLQPGVPAEVQLAWAVPEGALADGTASFDVYDARPLEGQILLSSSDVVWRRTDQVARVTVAVRS